MRSRHGMTLLSLLLTIIFIIFIIAIGQFLMMKLAISLLTSRIVIGIIVITCLVFMVKKALK